MSYADQVFVDMCRDILDNGTSTEGELVRPHWEDGSSAYTIKKFGAVNRYDLSKEFPAITLRKTYVKSATEEMLWIYQRKSSNIHDLNSTVWDEWADSNGSIGKAYGYQIGSPYIHHTSDVADESLQEQYPSIRFTKGSGDKKYDVWLDQMDAVLWDLKHTPFSRRIITTTWNVAELHEMNLQPCAYSMTYNVTQKKGDDRLTLNAVLNQRSQDVLTANNWNVCQYAVLLHMVAQVCGMRAGELVHVIADAHIYDRHVPIVEELIGREQHPAPKFSLNSEITDFYKFTKDDVTLTDYETGEQIKNIPVAV
jgi:thymidylate synthase